MRDSEINGIKLSAKDFMTDGKDMYIDPKLISGKPGMVLIHATWCSHCKHFKPVFNDLVRSIGDEFIFTSVESEILKSSQELSTSLNFQGYPTIKIFDKTGRIMGEYKGQRTSEAILKYICKVYNHCMKSK